MKFGKIVAVVAVVAVAAATLAFASSASATIIGFNGDLSFHYDNLAYNESGFTVTNNYQSPGTMLYWGGQSFNADPGGNTLSTNYGGSTMTLTKTAGGTFTFNSIDVGDVYNYGSSGDVRFDFIYGDNSSTSSTVTLDNLVGLQTFTFDLTNLMSVSWTALTTQGQWDQVDNVVLDGNSVPEPGSLALIGLGLAGLAAARRRKLV